MRIAVISDTHDRFPASLPAQLKGADEIWHLGDVCEPETLAEFQELGVPLRVVMGNCDATPSWPTELTITREGVKFFLTHIPPARAPSGVQVLLHGHTHVPRDDIDYGRVRWLNPGCITRPRANIRSYAWLTVESGRLVQWELVRI